ncbi:Phosphatidylserine decarboxylase proenzyme [Caloramator mitchellensis]|uniref:Phosphatidylserine decarboxylase proenzyme n=1 Tax=Caloramator mitchellensis TaxID=908809 RepID=A0A0R3JWS2_CALMK|nr:phosphatidylserine decarboxylase family protein [Caloramator mitchellensis]KRQ87991.1 Phosphatidylserine decarboxylase proenzyme [Caloramator mitchellensis]
MRIPVRKESLPYLIILSLLFAIFYYLNFYLSLIPLLSLLFIIYFFRDPDRKIILNDSYFLSPADGTVMEVKEIEESEFFKGKAIKVSIFLSIFNIHVNRSPIKGKVVYKNYRPGKYLPAFKSHASDINERNSIGIENSKTKVLVHQITGFVARRIVCWSNVNDNLEQGERFGLIKFGSCTEIIMPLNTEIKVKKGDTVKGGLTIIGVIK